LTLSAVAEPPPIVEPLVPPPSPVPAIEVLLPAPRGVDSASERASLLVTAVATIDSEIDALPADWAEGTREETLAAVLAELRIDRTYQSLTARTMTLANRRARLADVRGLERLLREIPQRDAALGAQRA